MPIWRLPIVEARPPRKESCSLNGLRAKSGEVYPENVGKLVMPGTKVGFQIHYHAVGEEITDTLEVAWWFHPKEKTPRYSAEYTSVGLARAGSSVLQIPPNTVTQHQGTTVLQAPAILHNFQPHMHYRGKAQTLEAIYPDGRREVINQVTRYTNTWHINYIYDPDYAPVFPKGTVLLVTSVHDNTAANKNNPDPRQWVSGGDRTVDEMGSPERAGHLHHRRGLQPDCRGTQEKEPRHRTEQQLPAPGGLTTWRPRLYLLAWRRR